VILAFAALAFVGAVLIRDGSQRWRARITKLQGMTVAQKTGPFRFETPAGKSRYTKLFACISEEEDGYVVQVRLSNEKKPENGAWAEEIVDSFETASELVAALAGEFSIAQAGIEIEIRMHNHKHGTRH
jgi:hypothetical protein